MIEAIKVPEIGENVESGVVVAVHIKAGDVVAVDDTVIELETDKALVEIPSPFNGRITEVAAKPGTQVKVGALIARVETDGELITDEKGPSVPLVDAGGAAGMDNATASAPFESQPSEPSPVKPQPPVTGREATSGRSPVPASPSVRRLARELGVDIADVRGSGSGGRISATDIKTHVRNRRSGVSEISSPTPVPTAPALPDFSRWGQVDIAPMETVRRLTAQSTTASWATIPHVTQFDEADITTVTAFIEKNRKKAEQAGAKLTLTAIITRVCAEALKRFPRFNATIDVAANRIIFKRYVHIGIAVDTPRGLLVPVVRDADRRNLINLAIAIADLAARARNKKIKPDELEGGTFSISNQGGIGGVGFTPIVLWPQVAILGVSRSVVKPVFMQDRFEPRTVLPLSLSYDHRIIDGADAARFLHWICEGLEQPMTLFID